MEYNQTMPYLDKCLFYEESKTGWSYFRLQNDPERNEIFKALGEDSDLIRQELGTVA